MGSEWVNTVKPAYLNKQGTFLLSYYSQGRNVSMEISYLLSFFPFFFPFLKKWDLTMLPG